MGAKQSRRQPSTSHGASPSQGEHAVRGTTRGSTYVIGVLVTVLILFLWLHFFVAHQNELTGRAIQERTAERARIERENMALRQQLAMIWAEPTMAQRARALNYLPQQPLYLLLGRPLVPTGGSSYAGPLLLSSIYRDVPRAESGPPASEASPAPQASSDSAVLTVAERP